jgi:hypothetical protein
VIVVAPAPLMAPSTAAAAEADSSESCGDVDAEDREENDNGDEACNGTKASERDRLPKESDDPQSRRAHLSRCWASPKCLVAPLDLDCISHSTTPINIGSALIRRRPGGLSRFECGSNYKPTVLNLCFRESFSRRFAGCIRAWFRTHHHASGQRQS